MTRYERTYGEKYDKDLDVVEIAKRIRGDIRDAQKNGNLPEDLKVSVRTKRGTTSSSITATVKEIPDGFRIARPATEHERTYGLVPGLVARTDESSDLLDELKGIMQAYNHDGSDIQTDYFDVRFYARACYASKLTMAHETEARAEAEAVLAEVA